MEAKIDVRDKVGRQILVANIDTDTYGTILYRLAAHTVWMSKKELVSSLKKLITRIENAPV